MKRRSHIFVAVALVCGGLVVSGMPPAPSPLKHPLHQRTEMKLKTGKGRNFHDLSPNAQRALLKKVRKVVPDFDVNKDNLDFQHITVVQNGLGYMQAFNRPSWAIDHFWTPYLDPNPSWWGTSPFLGPNLPPFGPIPLSPPLPVADHRPVWDAKRQPSPLKPSWVSKPTPWNAPKPSRIPQPKLERPAKPSWVHKPPPPPPPPPPPARPPKPSWTPQPKLERPSKPSWFRAFNPLTHLSKTPMAPEPRLPPPPYLHDPFDHNLWTPKPRPPPPARAFKPLPQLSKTPVTPKSRPPPPPPARLPEMLRTPVTPKSKPFIASKPSPHVNELTASQYPLDPNPLTSKPKLHKAFKALDTPNPEPVGASKPLPYFHDLAALPHPPSVEPRPSWGPEPVRAPKPLWTPNPEPAVAPKAFPSVHDLTTLQHPFDHNLWNPKPRPSWTPKPKPFWASKPLPYIHDLTALPHPPSGELSPSWGPGPSASVPTPLGYPFPVPSGNPGPAVEDGFSATIYHQPTVYGTQVYGQRAYEIGSTFKYATAMCHTPRAIEICRGAFPRFMYDVTTNQCLKFTWGGCHANSNNFETLELCEERKKVCNDFIKKGVIQRIIPHQRRIPNSPHLSLSNKFKALHEAREKITKSLHEEREMSDTLLDRFKELKDRRTSITDMLGNVVEANKSKRVRNGRSAAANFPPKKPIGL